MEKEKSNNDNGMSQGFDKRLYLRSRMNFKGISKRTAALSFTLFLFAGYEEFLIEEFDDHILPYLCIETNIVTHLSFSILFLVLLLPLCHVWVYKYKVSWLWITSAWLITALYIYCRLEYSYEVLPEKWMFGYTDWLLLAISFYTLSLTIIRFKVQEKNNKKINKEDYAVFREAPIKCKEEDSLEFWKDAEDLVKFFIKKIYPEDSYSIGIISDWGMGKTSYANLLKECLKKEEKEECIIINFNPSLSKRGELIQEDFFEALYSEIKKYNLAFSKLLERYLASIDVITNKSLFQRLKDLQRLSNPEEEREKLDKAIKAIEKRIVIFIDDLDRLEKEEILEVLKLIYHNASFTNIIFITFYSKNTMMQKLEEESMTPFSDKYFDREVMLPVRGFNDWFIWMIDRMDEELSKIQIAGGDHSNKKRVYSDVLKNDVEIPEMILSTPRDIKRFTSFFIDRYKRVLSEVNFYNYFYLYLLQYRYPDVFTKLYNKHYLTWINDEDQFYHLNEDVSSKENEVVYRMLKKLFPRIEYDGDAENILEPLAVKQKGNYRTINQLKYFDIYFRDPPMYFLSMTELDKLFENESNYIDRIAEWEGKPQMSYILEHALNKDIDEIKDVNHFKIYLDILLFLYPITENKSVFEQIENVVNSKNDIEKKYTNFKLDEHIRNIFTLKNKGHRFNRLMGIWIMELIDDKREDFIFSKENLQTLTRDNFKNYLEVNPQDFNGVHLNLLYTCIHDIDPSSPRKITLDKEACKNAHNQIVKYPDHYIKSFVRLGGWSSDDEFNVVVGEPFYSQIFNGNDNFEQFILSSELNEISNIQRVRNFWRLFKANNFKQIEFRGDGDVSEIIKSDFNREISRLRDLEDIDKIIHELESENQSYSLDDVDMLLERLDKIKLYIAMNARIRDKLNGLKRKMQDIEDTEED